MGYSQGTFTSTNSEEDPPPNDRTRRRTTDIKAMLEKLASELGLACFYPPPPRQRTQKAKETKRPSENNKAWLLAESGGCGGGGGAHILNNADPQSVHSSFRFSFCSQLELDSMNMTSSASATVLMVNLDSGSRESKSKEVNNKWTRIESLERTISPVTNSLVRFTFEEILWASRNFSKGRVLGRGALSYVFRGKVGFFRTSVAIKRLDKEDKESSKAFCRELMIASSLHHPNVVPLVGFCIDSEEGLFLVYNYVSGGSLERHLHEKKKGIKGSTGLSWSARYKVAVGVAQAVEYLHNGTERCVVHRDIKPSNILLSSRKTPKLCDFGMATWTSAPSIPFLCKTVKGTFGYLAPEYFQHGKVSDKTDIYALGIVLLELITGRKPIEARRPQGEENLVLWAKPLLDRGKGAIGELLDPRLECGSRSFNQMAHVVEAAAACVTSEESRRPAIGEIIAILRGQEEDLSGFFAKKNPAGFVGKGCVISRSSEINGEMKGHLALAMLGVSEFEDDAHLYCR